MTVSTFNNTSLGASARAVVAELEDLRHPERQWLHWQALLVGEKRSTPPGCPASGFYRGRFGECIAVWRDEGGALQWVVQGAKFQPRNAEQLDQMITGDGCRAITHEVYTQRIETGRWPDDIDPPAKERGLGDNSANLAAHEQIGEEIRDLLSRFQSWLKSIGGKIESEEQDAKADNYARAIGELKSKAETAHKTEKAYWLEGGRKVDGQWLPIVRDADSARKHVLGFTVDFRKAREEWLAKEREAELERRRLAAQEFPTPDGRPAPVSMPPKRASGLRTHVSAEIFDWKALLKFIADTMDAPPPQIEVGLQKLADKWAQDGTEAPGMRKHLKKRAV